MHLQQSCLVLRRLAFLILFAIPVFAQGDADQLFYTVSLARRADHVVHASLRVPAGAAASFSRN
jgi:hypothetical protein